MTRVPAHLNETKFDVIVIGAGINGAGIARDAAMRGLSVLLLDKDDIASGTSSASTRLIHGGLRYLEHGELGLVRESLRERETLFSIAPHLVRPIPMLIPIYKDQRRGPTKIRVGMLAYDLLSLGKSTPSHKMLSRKETLESVPGLQQQGLRGGAVYYDGHVEFAERLVLENALSARDHGATILTYARVDCFRVSNAQVTGLDFTDLLSGQTHSTNSSVVINASGPWVDKLLETTDQHERLIGGTKGSHIIVAPFAGAPDKALYVEAESDGRPFFVIPWNNNYLIGTTDIRYEGNLDHVRIEEGEIDYLLHEINKLIPTAHLTRQSVLFSYSGVRPLAFTRNEAEESITRRHCLREHKTVAGLISVVGGKLTTYRSLSEEAVNLVGRKLNRTLPRCLTSETPLPGAVGVGNVLEQLKNEKRLLRIYGSRAADVMNMAKIDKNLAERFDEETGAMAAEVIYSFQNELSQTLADCLLRRTMVGLNSTQGLPAAQKAAKIATQYLGWSDDRAARELLAYQASRGALPSGKCDPCN